MAADPGAPEAGYLEVNERIYPEGIAYTGGYSVGASQLFLGGSRFTYTEAMMDAMQHVYLRIVGKLDWARQHINDADSGCRLSAKWIIAASDLMETDIEDLEKEMSEIYQSFM